MTSRKRTQETARRLLGYWDQMPAFGEAIGCVVTTYTFDAGFFEEQCLARFSGIESDPAEEQHAYLVEREEKLSQLHATVLVDASHAPRTRSLRWNALPVALAGGGIMHAKVCLLAWREKVRLLVGSANLTEPGYRKNYEQMAVFDFGAEDGLPRELLSDAMAFIRRVAELAPGEASDGPRQGLTSFLQQVEAVAARWPEVAWPRGEPRARLATVLPGEPSLFDRLLRDHWSGARPEFASVMSPFFDSGDGVREVVDALAGIMAGQGMRSLEFIAPGRRQPDGSIEIDLPGVLERPWGSRREHSFGYVPGREEDGAIRELHAKSLWLERDGRAIYAIGSSNFTRAGTGVGTGPVNIEANVVYALPEVRSRFGDACVDARPRHEELDLKKAAVRFLTPLAVQSPEAASSYPLPPAFGLALYRAGAEGPRLELAIAGDAPHHFDVRQEDGRCIVDRVAWVAAGTPARLVVPWTERRPPSCLLIRWAEREADEPRLSVWPVNVADPAELPPPEVLRELDLEELIEILTSARPLHDAVALAVRRRAERDARAHGPIVDPHKKVDTRNFLLRRVRRLSEALEGLRERLGRPAYSLAGLQWRLTGPVGPLVLARRLAEQEGQGAAFMIAEVALTLRHADLAAVERGLGSDVVRAEVARAIGDLERLAAGHPSPPNLARYVDSCFEEVKE